MKRFYALVLVLVCSACSPSVDELLNAGINYMDAEDYQNASEQFYQVLEIDPYNYRALNANGVALLRLEKGEESIEFFTRAINIDTTNYRAFFNRGNALVAIGKDNDAMLDYDYAIGLQPDVVDLYLSRGSLLFKYDEFLSLIHI